MRQDNRQFTFNNVKWCLPQTQFKQCQGQTWNKRERYLIKVCLDECCIIQNELTFERVLLKKGILDKFLAQLNQVFSYCKTRIYI